MLNCKKNSGLGVYPAGLVEVLDFEYKDSLFLTRKIQAVQRRTGEDAKYVVARDYHACVTIRPYGSKKYRFPIKVPQCFLTDLSSAPRLVRPCISRVGPHLEASIVHDWLYTAWQLESPPKPTLEKRHFADQVFAAAMRKAEVTPFRIQLINAAVCIGGACSFERMLPKVFACDCDTTDTK